MLFFCEAPLWGSEDDDGIYILGLKGPLKTPLNISFGTGLLTDLTGSNLTVSSASLIAGLQATIIDKIGFSTLFS